MKKIIAILMTALMVVSLTIYVNAESNYYNALLQRGYSQEYLNTLSDNFIYKLYMTTNDCYVTNESTEIVELKSEGSVIETYGMISPNSMKLTVNSIELCKKGTNEVALLIVTVEWEWFDGKPAIRLNDAITVNWKSDLFYLMENGFLSEDRWCLRGAEDYWAVSKDYTAPAEITQGGLGYYTTLTRDPNFSTCLGGGTLISLVPCYTIYSGDNLGTGINVNYTHNRSIIIPTPTFSDNGTSISVSSLILYDQVGVTTEYRYN